MKTRRALMAALCCMLSGTATAQTRYYARTVVSPITTPAVDEPTYPGTWSVTLQANTMWSACSGGTMRTTNVNVACSDGECDPATKPVDMKETCVAKKACRGSFTRKATFRGSCASRRFMNGSFGQAQAFDFCSSFAGTSGCTILDNSQISACVGPYSYYSANGGGTNESSAIC
jgi:hypothetical protein